MKIKNVFFFTFLTFLVGFLNSQLYAVDTRDIDRVRDKQVLEDEDFDVIDDFLADAVRQIINTRDFTSIAKTRIQIISRSSSTEESAQAQYSARFIDSARKHVSQGLDQAIKIEEAKRRFRIVLNILILIEELADPQLVEKTIPLLNDENEVIRYWSVHCLTSEALVEKLNNTKPSDIQLALKITERFKKIAAQCDPETTMLIAGFSAGVNLPQAKELLLIIADTRIKEYALASVKHEFADGSILKLLYDKMNASDNNADVAQRFCQLYSYALQKYVRNITGKLYLDERAKSQLASILVEIENCCIWRLLDLPQAKIKRAIEQDDYMALLEEHSRLFGDKTRAGVLARKLNVKFKNPDGSERTYPLELPD